MRESLKSARRLLRFLMTHLPRLFWTATLLSVLATLTEGVSVLLLLPMLEATGVESSLSSTATITQTIKQFLGSQGAPADITAVLGLFFLAMTLHAVVTRTRGVVNARLNARVAASLRTALFEAAARTRWAFFCGERQASFTKALTLDAERAWVATWSAQNAAVALLVALVYLTLAFYVSPQVTLLVAATGTVIYATMARYLAKSAAIGGRTGKRIDDFCMLTGEFLSAMKTMKSYDKVDDCVARFDVATIALATANSEDGDHQANMQMLHKIGAAFGLCVIVYAAIQVFAIPTADLLFLLVLFSRVMPRVASLTADSFRFASHVTSFDAIEDLTARCVQNAESEREHVSLPASTRLTTGISVEDVSFGYDPARPVLSGVSLEIPVGNVVAIVGASGAGKTTLLDLIMGLLTPDAGCIRIDGQTMTPGGARSLRAAVGYVGQDTFLFNASVRENLLWGAAGAGDGEIRAALETACADFVGELEEGLETHIGDRGVRLSGGQRQRLSLARALLRMPSLLVLDEATNALDGDTESRILAAVRELRRDMTVLIVSHRPSAVRVADTVHVLEEGKISASGPWAEVGFRRPLAAADSARP